MICLSFPILNVWQTWWPPFCIERGASHSPRKGVKEAQISAPQTWPVLCFGDLLCVEEACFFLCLRNSCANWKEFRSIHCWYNHKKRNLSRSCSSWRRVLLEQRLPKRRGCKQWFLETVFCEKVVSYSWNKPTTNEEIGNVFHGDSYIYYNACVSRWLWPLSFWNRSDC